MLSETIHRLKQIHFEIKSLQKEAGFLGQKMSLEVIAEDEALAELKTELTAAKAPAPAPFTPKPVPLPAKRRAPGGQLSKAVIKTIKTMGAEGKSLSLIMKVTGVAWGTAKKYSGR